MVAVFLGRKLMGSLKRIKIVEKEKEEIAKKVEEVAIILNNKSKVYLDKLKYIKSDGNYLEFITDEKTIIDRNKLKDILDDLPPNFVRVHRSYVINKNFIDALNSTTLYLTPNIEIPLSRTFKSNIAS
jgi:DNA-binding LytR/AlgR family response regulator